MRTHPRTHTAGSQRAGAYTLPPRSPGAPQSPLSYRLQHWTRSAGFSSPSSAAVEAEEVTRRAGVCAPAVTAPALRLSPLGETKGSAGSGGSEVWATAALQVHHPQPPPAREGRDWKAGTRRRRPGRGARRGRTLKFPEDPPPAATTPLGLAPPWLQPDHASVRCHTHCWTLCARPQALITLTTRRFPAGCQSHGTPGLGRDGAPVPPPSPLASGLRVWERPRGGARRGRLYSSAPRPRSSWQEVRPWWPGK